MKKFVRFLLVIWTLSIFVLTLWVALVPTINNPKTYQKIWRQENTCERLGISEEEMTKVIKHTISYLWGHEETVQIQVTTMENETIDFYQHYGEWQGKQLDEVGHMGEVKTLFTAGKYLAIINLVLFVASTSLLIVYRKKIEKRDLRAILYTYAGIGGFFVIFAIACLINFTAIFELFHTIFFGKSDIAYAYPFYARMVIMLPENGLFRHVVYLAILYLVLMNGAIIGSTCIAQKKAFSSPKKI